ncbi:MAG: 16S rRNA (cytosine(967)-C(5))-methyltransferase RsmB [Proteobacteria bacterium]|nr:16S rRNA (cytosine(967)-C(5))-methyltransferase RsmB [Pseudomonadota bacterium]
MTGLGPRRLARDILAATARGGRPEALLAERLPSLPKTADRHLGSQLVYGTLRWQGRLDWIIDFLTTKPRDLLTDIRLILRLGLFQMIYLDRVPDHAVVDTAVGLAKEDRPRAAGLVNAVLRNFRRRADEIVWPDASADPDLALAVEWSLPLWLAAAWREQFGEPQALELARAQVRVPPLTLRANTLRTSRDELLARLGRRAGEVEPGRYGPEAILVKKPDGPADAWPEYEDGSFSFQDEAAQLVSHLAGARPGETVVDLCAGRGGKTVHLAALMKDQGLIHAWDQDQGRIAELKAESRRLGASLIRPMVVDATAPARPEVKADLVLVDAPCTGLGVIRRRPDIKWRIFRGDPAKMAGLQSRLMEAAADLVSPGGRLIYAVCTPTVAEGPAVIDRFLGQNPEFRLDPAGPHLPEAARGLADERGFFVTWPGHLDLDGFFAARLQRSSAPKG